MNNGGLYVGKAGTVLAIGAHPDDIELGCGGTIARYCSEGTRVICVYLTGGGKGGNAETRKKESIEACSVLGVREIHFGDFEDTEISCKHDEITFLEGFYEGYQPTVALTHSIHEMHQDHRNTAYVSLAAFRYVPALLSYETPRVMGTFAPSYFIDINRWIDLKRKALEAHKSQMQKTYMNFQSMLNLASYRGRQANIDAAEAFEVVRYVEL